MCEVSILCTFTGKLVPFQLVYQMVYLMLIKTKPYSLSKEISKIVNFLPFYFLFLLFYFLQIMENQE